MEFSNKFAVLQKPYIKIYPNVTISSKLELIIPATVAICREKFFQIKIDRKLLKIDYEISSGLAWLSVDVRIRKLNFKS